MIKKTLILPAALAILAFTGCTSNTPTTTTTKESNTPEAPAFKTTYTLLSVKDSIKKINERYPAQQLLILQTVNRVDAANLPKQDSLLIPANLTASANQYSPFPQTAPFLKDVTKIIFFSYPAQCFGAYENGKLTFSGPTNMGRQADPTPTGLFFTNWKAEETKSTFNDEWDLKWNFNIQNKEGVGWHQYALPGYPASHSCLRLREDDAKYLYTWAKEWVTKGKDEVLAKGTPVIVYGAYPFGSAKPWMQLTSNPEALNITAAQLMQEVQPHMDEIMVEQQKTAQAASNK